MSIHLLSEQTINQIAAGEVVESPASVVKELLENSLDAGAKKICVETLGGGLKLIRIADDGSGMSPKDAKLAILRHTTSKIVDAHDLFHIATKGFRGEALASIASISKMTIQTALGSEMGIQIEVENGHVVAEKSYARNRGTTVEVRSLFYNVPARKKFQKSAVAISAEIFKLMTEMALCHPETSFEFSSNNKTAFKVLATEDPQFRMKELLGDPFCTDSFPLHFEEAGFCISGIIGAPTNSRANRLGQHLFLNQRVIVCDPIAEAVRTAYGTRLEERRYPIFCLHIKAPADLIDVNVHPQKLTVRLRKEEWFVEKVVHAVEKALAWKVDKPFVVPSHLTQLSPLEVHAETLHLRFQENAPLSEQELPLAWDPLEVMGYFDRFIFFKEKEQICILDRKAASFRIHYEELIAKGEEKVEKQGLLIPFTICLTPLEAAMVLTHQEAIECLGFELHLIGKDTFMVEAIPSMIDPKDVEKMLAEMGEMLRDFIGKLDYKIERQKKLALLAARYATHSSSVSEEGALHLYKRLMACDTPFSCPKGTPTLVTLAYENIEDLFKTHRKVATQLAN